MNAREPDGVEARTRNLSSDFDISRRPSVHDPNDGNHPGGGDIMRRVLASVAGLACLLGVISGTLVANAGSSITAPETFTLVGSRDRLYLDDQGKPGVSPGDLLVFTLQTTDENGANVGKTRGQCTLHAGRWEICTYVWDIAGRGEIVAGGTYPPYEALDTPPFDFAVTGGTGDFSNVRGTVHVEVLDAAERFTFDLIP